MNMHKLLNIWNSMPPGTLRKNRLIEPILKDKALMDRTKQAFSILPNENDWLLIITAAVELMESDDFWRSRKGKQGIHWLFQNRGGKQSGEPNWSLLYDSALDKKESNAEKEEIMNNLIELKRAKVGELP
jgi:hypothetical protein